MASNFGSRVVVAIGGSITIATTLISSFTLNPLAFFMLYAVGFGVGKGFLYPAPLVAGWSHLDDRRGLVSGVVVSGLGIGAFTFGLLVSFLVNPENLKPELVEVVPGVQESYFTKEVSDRVPTVLRTLCIVYGVLILIGIIAISNFVPSEE